jgi:hypothetical protein
VGCLTVACCRMRHCSVSAPHNNQSIICVSPRLHLIHGPAHPFTRTAVRDEDRRVLIQDIHWTENPLALSTALNPSQCTISNALAKSSLSTIAGFFLLWQTCSSSNP